MTAEPLDIVLSAFTKGMEAAALARWVAPEGGWIAEGDVLAEVETDKATMEIEAPCDGVLLRRLEPAGPAKLPVGRVLARFQPGPKPAVSSVAPTGLSLRSAPSGPIARLTMAEAMRAGLAEAMRADPRRVILAEAARQGGRRGALRGFAAEFGDRMLDAPAAADAALDHAIGALIAGAAPILMIELEQAPPAALKALARRAARFEATAMILATVDATTRAALPGEACALAPCDVATMLALTRSPPASGLSVVLIDATLQQATGDAPQRPAPPSSPKPELARAGAGPMLIGWGSGVAAALAVAERLDAAVVDLARLDGACVSLSAALAQVGRGVVVDPAPGLGYGEAWAARLAAECHGALAAPLRRCAADPAAILAALA